MHSTRLQPLTRHCALALLAGAALAGPAIAQDAAKQPQLIVFDTQARVEIDASGKVLSVAPDPKLLPLVANAIQSTAAALVFVPPSKDGQPVGGVTYVHLSACAAAVDDGFRLAVDYRSHGPSRAGPQVPEFEQGGARTQGAVRESMRQWIAANRFEPELVAGIPVATRVSLPIEFIVMKKPMTSGTAAMREVQALMQAGALQNTTCQAALAEASKKDTTLVLDSPFKLLPAG